MPLSSLFRAARDAAIIYDGLASIGTVSIQERTAGQALLSALFFG
jgi:hypothetical protein